MLKAHPVVPTNGTEKPSSGYAVRMQTSSVIITETLVTPSFDGLNDPTQTLDKTSKYIRQREKLSQELQPLTGVLRLFLASTRSHTVVQLYLQTGPGT